jgi:DNA segregation ATPase FtsK/SpoIIIE, S-DNA-T family
MAKKNKHKRFWFSLWPGLAEETRQAIWAVIFVVIGFFFLASQFEIAGPAGQLIYTIMDNLFGLGAFLIPLVFLTIGVSFIKAIQPHFLAHRIIGGLFLFASLLGIVDLAIGQKAGGLIGDFISTPMLSLFDLYFSFIFLGAVALISFMVIFETKLSLENRLFGLSWKRKEKTETDDEPQVSGYVEEEAEEENEDEVEKPKKEIKKTPVEKDSEASLLQSFINFGRKSKYGEFSAPPLSLLEKDSGKPGVGDIKANSNIIKRTLANFGISVEMDEISIGPSITRYALKPAEGIKLSRIVGLQNDLSLALAAHPLRIEAPIPGKSLVGIEIPNTSKTTVGLATLLSAKEFTDSHLPLLVSLGRGISGVAHFANVAKAPHLLIAGATGSGKSVTIHTAITSLLYRNPPDRLRFIMIDPKRVELTLYNKIPHLLTPVITDAKKTIQVLRWAAKEMDRRYDILEAEAVRDIQSYHKNVLEPALAQKTKNEEADENDVERMPYIVIVIDELADIMSSYPRELESAVVRLAQMSRAVGIHLILSTQRPSVEVITGLIKANIPSRIALQVASQIDSRTIIDMPGAEKLLGAGDMLYLSSDMSKPIRIQSAFISEQEVKRVVKYLSDRYADEIPTDINLTTDELSSSGNRNALFNADFEDDDELYEDARQAVIDAGKASTTYLQRKLKIGYARAARLMDMLEERGIVGPGEGAKPREVYDQPNENDES